MPEVSSRLDPLFCLLNELSRLGSGLASAKLGAVWLWIGYLEPVSFLRCALLDICYLIL